MKEGVDKNLVIKKTLEYKDKLKEKLNNDVHEYMKKNYENFDFDVFEQEIQFIFE